MVKLGKPAGDGRKGVRHVPPRTPLEPLNPYQYALKCFGGKWKMTILHEMDVYGEIRFNHTRRAIKVSEKVFSEQMGELIECGLARRYVDVSAMPPAVTYRLTEQGKELIPVIDEVYLWAVRNMSTRRIPIDPDAVVMHSGTKYRERLAGVIDFDADGLATRTAPEGTSA